MIWSILLSALLSMGTGIFLSKYLTSHPLKMDLYLTLCLCGTFLNLVLIYLEIEMVSKFVVGGNLIIFGFIGYVISSKVILSREEKRYVPLLADENDVPESDHTAIIYFTHGEPELYNPMGWIDQFREFDEMKIKFIPFLARPIFLYKLRRSYLKVGKSGHRQEHKRMLKSLKTLYEKKTGQNYKFYLCFLDDWPKPSFVARIAINDGAKKIIVANVFLTLSNHTLEGKKLIDKLPLDDYGVEVKYTAPLFDSNRLVSAFISKVTETPYNPPYKDIGIILVGHGQPDEWDVEFETETLQEIYFREKISAEFQKLGFKKENIKLAWMEFKSPKPKQAAEELLANKVKRIFYFSAAISADSIHSQYDVPRLISQVPLNESADVINLGAWNNHPAVIEAIKERIDEVL